MQLNFLQIRTFSRGDSFSVTRTDDKSKLHFVFANFGVEDLLWEAGGRPREYVDPMEGEKEGMDRDRHDPRVNQDGYQQDLLEKENTSHPLYSVVAHRIKQDKGCL